MPESPILRVEDLKAYFFLKEGVLKAVDGISFEVRKGETLSFVGESGSGKSVTALCLLRLIQEPPGKIVSGRIMLDGTDLLQLSLDEVRRIRGKRIAMIFQDPMTSLNPVLSIGLQIAESIQLHQGLDRTAALRRAVEMLRLVRIPNPEKRIAEYPHQLSGGMRQRVMIAMALSCHPQLLVADEPTTALDVTIQAQVLTLMRKLKDEMGASILLITHDLGVVAEMADRVLVMYAGKIVEKASIRDLFRSPLHPYTQGLLASVPRVDQFKDKKGKRRPLREIPGLVPRLVNMAPGCVFAPRCFFVKPLCKEVAPALRDLERDHAASCWLFGG